MGELYKRGDRWGIDYRDGRGTRVRRIVATDKVVATKILGDAVKASERVRAGVVQADPREGKRPFAQHLEVYLADLKRLGRDLMYIYIIRRHLENAAEEQKWSSITCCTPESIGAWLKALSDRGLSAKTLNAHRADLAAFLEWCQRTGRVESNACLLVAKTTDKSVKTRRALSVGECRALLKAAPDDRRVAYLFLLFTGLRRSEAGALKWAHVRLDSVNPYIELPPTITKSGRPESVPLVPEVAAALRGRRGKAGERDPVFEEVPSMPDFREDLAAAGIDEVDSRGRKVVLHSLRHSLATMLAISGVPMAIAQRIMRHRDIRLTAEVYTDEGLLPLAAAMAALPSMAEDPPARRAGFAI